MNTKKRNQEGFTIIELIIIIAILGVLILIASSKFLGYTEKARTANIINDIKIAENIIAEHLLFNDELPNNWQSVDLSYLKKTASQDGLYNKKGITKTVTNAEYKEIDKTYLKEKMNTQLGGRFYASKLGNVYYEDDKPSKLKPEENLFDRDVIIENAENGKIQILNYNFPNGIYRPKDIIKGNITVKGLQEGNYVLKVEMQHSKAGNVIENSLHFDLKNNQIKTINFDYEVTNNDRMGFYDFNLIIKENENSLTSYLVPQSIYITQNDWEYFYEDDFNEMNRETIGQIGSLNPNKVNYKYVIEPSGIDYSNIIFEIEPGNNQTGQVQTKLPITYGTYEAMMKVPNNDSLLNGFFLYGDDKYNPKIHYEIDIEILFYEGKWQAWTTIFNESNKDYVYNGIEPGVIFHKRIDLNFDPSEDYHSYRIDFYDNFVSFAIDGKEVSRWDNSFDYGDMYMYTGNFYTHWLTSKFSDDPLQMNVKWIRRGYFPQ